MNTRPVPGGDAPVDSRPFWWDAAGIVGTPTRPPLREVAEERVDVVVVGAGYTGLWTAYHLARSDPGLSIVVLESEFVGHGASGRNGGWLSASFPGSRELLAAERGPAAVRAMVRALADAVPEVLYVAAAEGIEMDAAASGCLRVATTPAQARRLADAVGAEARWDAGSSGWRLLGRAELDARVRIPSAVLAAWTPRCARIQPARLLTGLAAAVERLGVRIYEGTRVVDVRPGEVRTTEQVLRARHVLRATEGFTCRLPGLRRRWLPMNSSMIVTEPLDESTWDAIGWQAAETLSDVAHAYAYLQRTSDGRIAIGGRGRPYRYGGRFDPAGPTPESTVRALREVLGGLFPAVRSAPVAAAWSGVLAVPRDWCGGVGYDPVTGTGWAGGYAGHGVCAAYLAGRTLADLVQRRGTHLTGLPWVGHQGRDWEPEPLRWLGVQATYAAYRAADRAETRQRSDRSALLARVADRVSGR